jgi:hypothetical protein
MLRLRYVRPILLRRIKINHISRYDDNGEVPSSENLSTFSNPGRPTPKNAIRKRYLSKI